MVASVRTIEAETPEHLRTYLHHGLDLSVKAGQANGDCPFCASSGKFTVHVETGLWRCFVCGGGLDGGGGNALSFLRLLHERSMALTPTGILSNGHGDTLDSFAANRRLCSPDTLTAWGVAQSIITHSWLVPGYGVDGKLNQLYKYVQLSNGYRLLPTPGIWQEGKSHALHLPIEDFDAERPTLVVCEGPWDAMALWEVNRDIWGSSNIIAVPGSNVWRDEWSKMCEGKMVFLLYDSDHPRKQGTYIARAGYDGMVRVAKHLSGIAGSIRWVKWGKDGYDDSKPSGWDVRDELTGVPGPSLLMVDRHERLSGLLEKIVDVPPEICTTIHLNGKAHGGGIEPQSCSTWKESVYAWDNAMRWRNSMSDALAVLLAVCASTQQAGNQLFLQLIGDPGSGKTTMCEGLLTSTYCHHLEHLTGFHSGWKGETDGQGKAKDCSLIARVNGKTLVTPEADVMMSSPKFHEIMSQQRRIFDGKSGATYKNSSEDVLHVGLRTPWIMAGTPKMIFKADQSQLGDRFLRMIIDEPTHAEKRLITHSALRSERIAMLDSGNGTAGSIIDPKTRKAQALTGGYVNWLRANVENKLASIEISEEVDYECVDLAELSADLRARPDEVKDKKDNYECKELPTRLARQNIRLAAHLAVVLNKRAVDKEVMKIVRKVAMDTAHGHSLSIVGWFCSFKNGTNRTHQQLGGIPGKTLQEWLHMQEERCLNYLMFLRKLDILKFHESRVSSGTWLLTDRVVELAARVQQIGV